MVDESRESGSKVVRWDMGSGESGGKVVRWNVGSGKSGSGVSAAGCPRRVGWKCV